MLRIDSYSTLTQWTLGNIIKNVFQEQRKHWNIMRTDKVKRKNELKNLKNFKKLEFGKIQNFLTVAQCLMVTKLNRLLGCIVFTGLMRKISFQNQLTQLNFKNSSWYNNENISAGSHGPHSKLVIFLLQLKITIYKTVEITTQFHSSLK